MNKNEEFIDCLFYHYIKNDVKYLEKARRLAKGTEFEGWPDDKEKFWDAESFVWKLKIESVLKQKIKEKLEKYVSKNNLCLGSGNNPLFESKVYVDISEKMLERVQGEKLRLDLDKEDFSHEEKN